RVAVIDDGFDLEHPDLAPNFSAEGYDVSALPNGEADNDPSAESSDFHGTQTAGVIAAVMNNDINITGICPECEILPVRLLGFGGPFDLYQSQSWVAAEAIIWAVEHGAAVINNSWGPPDGNPNEFLHSNELFNLPEVVSDAFTFASRCGRGGESTRDNLCSDSPGSGTLIVFAAGNGNEPLAYDGYASDPRTLAVGAINAQGLRTYYSDYGPQLDIVAPSGGRYPLPKITTTDLHGSAGLDVEDSTDQFSGTSASAAMVSAAAGLILSGYPELTLAQLKESLLLSAMAMDTDLAFYNEGRSQKYGYGRLDVSAALSLAASYESGCSFYIEACGNLRDDDCDGISDSDEPECQICIPDANNEVCDGRDNNCDGYIDEYFICETNDKPICAPCESSHQCGEALSCLPGGPFIGNYCLVSCSDNNDCPNGYLCQSDTCLPASGDRILDCLDILQCGGAEECDGIDNDCNGIIDDIAADGSAALSANAACDQQGVCEGKKAWCHQGSWLCQRAEEWQADENKCDALDNDCDGQTDEGALCEARAKLQDPPDSNNCNNLSPTAPALPAILLLLLYVLLIRRTRPIHLRRSKKPQR
ncbi:S8 family serine peptidase, partial [Myxococcota bacterium]|nr:S8 family serine peptidase [Myxococcota bacterium]